MSFLESENVVISNVQWREDDLGDYWSASFHDKATGVKGVTGTYYILCEDGHRPSKERQAEDLRSYNVVKEKKDE